MKKDVIIETIKPRRRLFLSCREKIALREVVAATQVFAGESAIYRILGVVSIKFWWFVRVILFSDGVLLCARVDGDLAGYALAQAEAVFSEYKNFEITTIYVLPQYRNGGAGSALADALVDQIEAHGCSFSHVSICADFADQGDLIQRATELAFRRRGFKPVGVIMGRPG